VDALQPGDPLGVGRYRLLKRLGTGGMGRVYLGQSPGGCLVAVKLIRPELADDPDFRRRFAQEVHAARRVGGIFTAPVVDADPDGPQPWLVTAYVDGPSLSEAVTAQGPMPIESVLALASGLAEGLAAVHAAGVVHRDLKPSNVLLACDGPRIIDFGISRALDATALTNASGVVGSPGFMSPEQAEGHQVGPPTDIFSLGGVLAFAATGEPPFGAGSASALLYRVVYGTAATGHVPAGVRPLIERCLAKDPAQRPTTGELLAELGYAASTASWLSWHGVVIRTAGELPPTELDQHQDGNGADSLHPAPDSSVAYPDPDAARQHPHDPLPASDPRPANDYQQAADRAPVKDDEPASGAGPARSRSPDAGGRHGRARHARRSRWPARRRSVGLIAAAVAAVLVLGTAAVVAFAVLSHRDHDMKAGSASPLRELVHARAASTGSSPAAPPGRT
jgi:serine/threonine protein kinase